MKMRIVITAIVAALATLAAGSVPAVASRNTGRFKVRSFTVEFQANVPAPVASNTNLQIIETTGTAAKWTVQLSPNGVLSLNLYNKKDQLITRDARPLDSIIGPSPFYGVTFRYKVTGEQGTNRTMSAYLLVYSNQGVILGAMVLGPMIGRLGRLQPKR